MPKIPMDCSVEISMYPLDKNYIEPITTFIENLRKHPFIKVETNGMSTQIFGNYDNVMKAVNNEMKSAFLIHNKVVFSMKVINAHLQEKPSF